jgi:hypothetical protein
MHLLSRTASQHGKTSSQLREVSRYLSQVKPGLESREYGLEIRHADHVSPFYPQKLSLASPTSGCRSVGMVRSRTKATEFIFSVHLKAGNKREI